MTSISCLVLIGPAGQSAAERWVHEGQLAASLDLIDRLLEVPSIGEISILTPNPQSLPLKSDAKLKLGKSSLEGFDFGATLLAWAVQQKQNPLAYFGGSSAPLLGVDELEEIAVKLTSQNGPDVITNNRYSSDWAVMKGVKGAEDFLASLESDNPLGWGLQNQVGFRVEDLPASSLSRTDIDTPMDLLMLLDHPRLGSHLAEWLTRLDSELQARVRSMRQLLLTPAATLMIIGRSSATAWGQLEARTQVWTRLMVEERGMLASGRFRRREVQSILSNYIDEIGVGAFVEEAAAMADGILWDNRVWLAASGGWPDRGQRFAADLGWRNGLTDERLINLVEAVERVDIPVLNGGHGLVSGGLMAMLDGLT